MGVCTSTKGKATFKIDKGENLDFEYYRELVRDQKDAMVFEVKAKLWEFIEVSPKMIKKNLVCKYLFVKPNGKFESRIKQALSGEEMFIEGVIEKNGNISFSYKQKMLNNNSVKVRYYEAKLALTNDGLQCKGPILETSENIGEGKVVRHGETFLLDFNTKLWRAEYLNRNKSLNQFNVLLKIKNFVLSGISIDEKGVSVFAGVENDNKISLIQQYIDKDYTNGATLEAGTFSYSGVIDKINNEIAGNVKNKELDNDTKFTIKLIGKPFSGERTKERK